MKRTITIVLFVGMIILLVGGVGAAGEKSSRPKLPLTEKQMKAYEKIPFNEQNLAKVERGMTQTEVLELLGKPLKITKEHRRHNRWTVHYFYPDGHIVNFKDGLVVGKE